MENEWLAVHIYTEVDLTLLIANLLPPISSALKEDNIIKSFFFIRYWEGGQHLRFRVLPAKSSDQRLIIEIIKKKCRAYFEQIQASAYQLEVVNYERENERYGGESGLLISENFFNRSSEAVINAYQNYLDNWGYDLSIAVAIQAHVIFINAFFPDQGQQLDILTTLYNNWMPYCISSDYGSNITLPAIERLNDAFEQAYVSQQIMIKKILAYSLSPNLEGWEGVFQKDCAETAMKLRQTVNSTTYASIADSLLHMTNNRIGIYLRDEAYIWYIIRRALVDQNYR